MPGSYLIDLERGIVFSRAWGTLNPGEVAVHAESLKADPRFDPTFRQIVDFRDVTELPISTSDVRTFATITAFRRDARRAFVVGTDEAYGLLRMFWAFSNASEQQFGLFRELPPAMAWIELDPQTPWPSQPPDKQIGED